MVTKSRLKMALQAEKGVDFKKQKQKKKAKEAEKRKRAQVQEEEDEKGEESSAEEAEEKAEGVESEDDDDEEEEEEEEEENQIDLEGVDDSDTSESSIELEDRLPRKPTKRTAEARRVEQNEGEGEDDEEEDEEDEDIPMSDLEDLSDADKEDLIPHQRLTINNTSALLSSLSRIALPADSSVPFASHQSVVSASATADSIPDVADDLQRELAFSAQSLEAVRIARSRLRAEGVPFSRPKDYFAEMVKEDAHMDKVKAKLVEEASNKKAAAEARKLRDLKKFGKQVQVAKLQERQKAKRETLDKIKNLKRKRQENSGDLGTTEADLFDVGVDSELKKHSQRSGAGRGQPAANGKTNFKRQKKNEKYGFGGKKRHAKSGDALSSGDLSGFDAKRMKAGGRGKVAKSQRPGKARRKAMGTR